MPEQTINHIEDDTIDLRAYLKLVLKYKYFLFFFIGLSLIGCLFFNHSAKSRYLVQTSFFLPSEEASGGLMGYAKLFGVANQSSIGDYLIFLVKSRKMRTKIEDSFDEDFKNDSTLDLRLQKRLKITRDPSGLFLLQFQHENPLITYRVINACLQNLDTFNRELELSAQKNILIILDAPELPKKPSWPNKKINLIVTFISALFLGILIVFIIDYFKSE